MGLKKKYQCLLYHIPLMLLCFLVAIHGSVAQPNTIIQNDTFWFTTSGQPIYSQGGGIFRFKDPASGIEKYYWYGVRYKEAETYRLNPAVTLPTSTFESVTCYSSTDLVNWTFENNVLTMAELEKNGGYKRWLGRLGVAWLEELKKYVMVVQHGNQVLFTTADTPAGNFSWHNQISMKEMIGTPNTGDQTVFTDDDGKSYLIYSYGSGRNKIYVSEIGVKEGKANLLDCKEIFRGESREGNCMFKYNGKYYMAASNIYGWDASLAYYLVADDIHGPYTPSKSMAVMKGCEDDYAHITQTGFFVSVKGTKQETILYCGDRWADFAGNGLGYNQWFPMSFEGSTPVFNSLHRWNLNAQTGSWSVAPGNNYVRNASFEADRRYVPTHVKPVQDQLTGWYSTVLKGNAISQDSLKSPVLNYFNTEADRKIVIGEKSLAITDNVVFHRRVSQTISSTPFVKLPDGRYRLSAMIRSKGSFTSAFIYANSSGKMVHYNIINDNNDWKKITLTNIKIRKGKVEIGFEAEGDADAVWLVDDVELVRE
jgi:Glycosyl hydrolases family 43